MNLKGPQRLYPNLLSADRKLNIRNVTIQMILDERFKKKSDRIFSKEEWINDYV